MLHLDKLARMPNASPFQLGTDYWQIKINEGKSFSLRILPSFTNHFIKRFNVIFTSELILKKTRTLFITHFHKPKIAFAKMICLCI
jgi:hypothetical protein